MIAFIGMMYALLAVIRSKLNSEHKVVDIETDTAADFSIMVTYLPKTTTEQEIKNFFDNHIQGVRVVRVSMAFNTKVLKKLLKEEKHSESQLINLHSKNFIRKEDGNSNMFTRLAHKLTRLTTDEYIGNAEKMAEAGFQTDDPKYIEAIVKLKTAKNKVQSERLNISNNHEQYFTGVAFVSFERMGHADKYVNEYFMSSMRWFFGGCKYKLRYPNKDGDSEVVRIDPAPEAEEVIWDNLRYPFKIQLKRRIKTALVVCFIMAVAFAIIYGLKYAKYKIKKSYLGPIINTINDDGTSSQKHGDLRDSEVNNLNLISIAIFIVCKLTNKIFDHIIADMTVMEKHYSVSDFYSSAMIKTIISQFINTSILIAIVHYVLKGQDRHIIWGTGGLIVDIWYLIFFNALIMPLIHILNFEYIVKLFKRCRLRRHKDSKRYTQLQAHKICEGVPMDAVRCYTDIYQLLLTGLFFTPVFPITAALFFVSLVCVYWIEKHYLLRMYTIPILLQDQIPRDAITFIKVGAFSLSLGMFYFDWILRTSPHNVLSVLLAITFVIIFIPIENAFQGFYSYSGEEADIKKNLTYDDALPFFLEDYVSANPVTGHESLKKKVKNITKTKEVTIAGRDHINIITSKVGSPGGKNSNIYKVGSPIHSIPDDPEAQRLRTINRRGDRNLETEQGLVQITHQQVRVDVGEIPDHS